MISIIICSANKTLLDKAVESIKYTIEIPYEIIAIENSSAQYGICDAYNQGAQKAIYDILCFMHEDISFETNGWGEKVIAHLKDPSVGLIGLAGGDTKSLVPTSWSSSIFNSEISLIQHYKDSTAAPKRISQTGYPEMNSIIRPVVCLDGVWMCIRKDVYIKHKFDGKTFSGFHGYDIDFSLQVSRELRVCVVFDIIIHHFSEGNYSKAWMENMIRVSDKWCHQLPASVRNLSHQEFTIQHWTSMEKFLMYLIKLNYSLPVILKYFFKYSFNRYFKFKYFGHFLKYIFVNYFLNKKRNSNLYFLYP